VRREEKNAEGEGEESDGGRERERAINEVFFWIVCGQFGVVM
jgi:hypothetical protein